MRPAPLVWVLSFAIAAAFAAGASVAPARASSVVPMDLPALARGAALIVEVDALSEQVVPDAGRIPLWTETLLRVTRVHKAPAGEATEGKEIVLRHPGGRTPKATLVAAGFPAVPPGSKALLFLSRMPKAGTYRVFGLEQGAYFVLPAASGAVGSGPRAVRADALHDGLAAAVTTAAPNARAGAGVPLATLRARIAEALAAGAAVKTEVVR